MYRSKKNVFTVVKVEPRLVDALRNFTGGVRRRFGCRFEFLGLDHGFYDFLSSITVVHVEVHDGNLTNFVSVVTFQVRSCHSYVVDEAKPVAARFLLKVVFFVKSFSKNARMVAWGSDCTKSIAAGATHYGVTSLHRSACCM